MIFINETDLLADFKVGESKTIRQVVITNDRRNLYLNFGDRMLRFFVYEDCCNDGWLEDLDERDYKDIIGRELTQFVVRESDEYENNFDLERVIPRLQDYYRFTYYTIGTPTTSTTFCFRGTSNGYYTMTAEIEVIPIENNPLLFVKDCVIIK